MRVFLALGGVVAVVASGCADRPVNQRQFCEMVQERVLETNPGVLVTAADESGFDFATGTGARGRILVEQEYLYYLRHPESLDRLVDRLASLVSERERVEGVQDDAERARRSLLPVLKPHAFLPSALQRSAGQDLLYSEHPTGFLVFYVLDSPTSMSYLLASSAAGLGLDEEGVEQLALSNLAQRTAPDRFVVRETEAGPMAVGDTLDGYDATRLISPNLFATLFEVLRAAEVIVAVPRRDLILAAPAGSQALRERIGHEARTEHLAGPHPLTPDLFFLDHNGPRPLTPH